MRKVFKKKLAERLKNLHVSSAQLSGHKDRYKIKLRDAGYRLIYEVRDMVLVIVVVAVGKRERNMVYKAAAKTSKWNDHQQLNVQSSVTGGDGARLKIFAERIGLLPHDVHWLE